MITPTTKVCTKLRDVIDIESEKAGRDRVSWLLRVLPTTKVCTKLRDIIEILERHVPYLHVPPPHHHHHWQAEDQPIVRNMNPLLLEYKDLDHYISTTQLVLHVSNLWVSNLNVEDHTVRPVQVCSSSFRFRLRFHHIHWQDEADVLQLHEHDLVVQYYTKSLLQVCSYLCDRRSCTQLQFVIYTEHYL